MQAQIWYGAGSGGRPELHQEVVHRLICRIVCGIVPKAVWARAREANTMVQGLVHVLLSAVLCSRLGRGWSRQ